MYMSSPYITVVIVTDGGTGTIGTETPTALLARTMADLLAFREYHQVMHVRTLQQKIVRV